MVAPDLINAEVASTLRNLERAGKLSPARAGEALDDLSSAPVRRYSTTELIGTAWRMRKNLSVYDALSVALAQALDVPLVTGDRRLAAAPNLAIAILVV